MFLPKPSKLADPAGALGLYRRASDTRPLAIKSSDARAVAAAVARPLDRALRVAAPDEQQGFISGRSTLRHILALDVAARRASLAAAGRPWPTSEELGCGRYGQQARSRGHGRSISPEPRRAAEADIAQQAPRRSAVGARHGGAAPHAPGRLQRAPRRSLPPEPRDSRTAAPLPPDGRRATSPPRWPRRRSLQVHDDVCAAALAPMTIRLPTRCQMPTAVASLSSRC